MRRTVGFISQIYHFLVLSLPFPHWFAASPHSIGEWIPPPGRGLRGVPVSALKTVWIIGHRVRVGVSLKYSLSPHVSLVMNWQRLVHLMTTETRPQS